MIIGFRSVGVKLRATPKKNIKGTNGGVVIWLSRFLVFFFIGKVELSIELNGLHLHVISKLPSRNQM